MIECPNCKNKELEGSLFCSECGSQFVVIDALATQSLRRVSTNSLSFSPKAPFNAPSSTGQNAEVETVVSLHLIESGQVVHYSAKKEFTLGRSAEGQASAPDVDLSPYDAYKQGVSRLHATIKVSPAYVFISDLGSSNGTRVNGQKITPNIEFPLNHGDLIALGKLKIQFLIRK
jgi:pSer/pThr/pTyr-binding forkhead associated (FHA) protein